THPPLLGHAHQRVVHRHVAVGMVLSEHLADHGGALLVTRTGGHAGIQHRPENAPLRRFQSVAHVRQRAADDHAHRVVHVGRAHLLLELDRMDAAGFEHCHQILTPSLPAPTWGVIDIATAPLTSLRVALSAAAIAFTIASASERPCAITTSPATPSIKAPPV